jgi:hypothetical protein
MTEVKKKAVELINQLPDDKMTYILGILQVFEKTRAAETETGKTAQSRAAPTARTREPAGYQRLLKYRGTLNRHIDIKKELSEARDEKYARSL